MVRASVTAPACKLLQYAQNIRCSSSCCLTRGGARLTMVASVQGAEAAVLDVTNGSARNALGVRQESQHRRPHRHRHSLQYHIAFLFLGFLSICLSGYVLSHASTTISDEIGISDVLFGVVILSIATTLPEKFIVLKCIPARRNVTYP
jgi:hypothetical protein